MMVVAGLARLGQHDVIHIFVSPAAVREEGAIRAADGRGRCLPAESLLATRALPAENMDNILQLSGKSAITEREMRANRR